MPLKSRQTLLLYTRISGSYIWNQGSMYYPLIFFKRSQNGFIDNSNLTHFQTEIISISSLIIISILYVFTIQFQNIYLVCISKPRALFEEIRQYFCSILYKYQWPTLNIVMIASTFKILNHTAYKGDYCVPYIFIWNEKSGLLIYVNNFFWLTNFIFLNKRVCSGPE